MLVLGRKCGEKVLIDGGIVVSVEEVDRATGKVKLGFVAPAGTTILRAEVQDDRLPAGERDDGDSP